MIIYCDIGNTNTRFFSRENTKLLTLLTKEFISLKEVSFFKLSNLIDKLIFCSVVPEKTMIIKNECESMKIIYEEITHKNIQMNCAENIDKSKIGIDILLNAWYCQKTNANCLVVNFGTATTISSVENNVLIGYLILPGFTSSLEAIKHSTALVKTNQILDFTNTLGLNTNEAVSFGIVNSQFALVKELKSSLPNSSLFVSGKNVENMIAVKKLDYTFIAEITVKALAYFFN